MSFNRITFLVVVAVFIFVAASYAPVGARQQPDEPGRIIPGCAIPRHYGRLVTIMPGNNSGLAGQAVFEAENGVIRWVPFMFNSTATITAKPGRGAPPANFPSAFAIYECAQGHVWERP